MKSITLSEILAFNRVEKFGWTIEQAAKEIGLRKGQLHDLESGANTNPTFKTLIKLCNGYKIAPAMLFYHVGGVPIGRSK